MDREEIDKHKDKDKDKDTYEGNVPPMSRSSDNYGATGMLKERLLRSQDKHNSPPGQSNGSDAPCYAVSIVVRTSDLAGMISLSLSTKGYPGWKDSNPKEGRD